MSVGLFIIGDEILSGKRRDQHLAKVIELLRERGMSLDWAQMLGDDQAQIAAAIRVSHARGDVVLSCGGIGATPDDRTRQAAALAFDVPLCRHLEAERLIVAEYAERAYPNRVLMADFPEGADLIPNPVNRVSGFSLHQHFFVPGFPEMAWPMLEWVLDSRLSHLHVAEPAVEYSLRALGNNAEGDLLELMEETLAQYPGIALSSLPSRSNTERPRHIEFGIKGPPALAAQAFLAFRARLAQRPELQIEDLSTPA